MQGIKKNKIVIASVLKPVDDTRMFEKIGQSLSGTGRFDLHLIGYPTQQIVNTTSDLTLHASRPFKRLSFSRVIQPFRILRLILQLKPAVIIITSHELLVIAVFLKLMTGCGLLYDVQENYYKNILYTNAFPFWMRLPLAIYVRTKEMLLSPFVNHFILAERCYEKELKFVANKNIVLENKVKKPIGVYPKKSQADKLIHLLFNGTLAETTGVFGAIVLAKKLNIIEPKIRLTLVGFSPQPTTLKRIKKEIEGFEFIDLIGGSELVPHSEIIKEIQQSDFGIIAYPLNKSTENRIPTKLYEYLGYKLPILLTDHKAWVQKCSEFSAAISVDFSNPDVSSILHDMNSKSFYKKLPENVFWENDAIELIALIEHTKVL